MLGPINISLIPSARRVCPVFQPRSLWWAGFRLLVFVFVRSVFVFCSFSLRATWDYLGLLCGVKTRKNPQLVKLISFSSWGFIGAACENRTHDLLITSETRIGLDLRFQRRWSVHGQFAILGQKTGVNRFAPHFHVQIPVWAALLFRGIPSSRRIVEEYLPRRGVRRWRLRY